MENQLRIHSNLTTEDMMYNHNIDKKNMLPTTIPKI